MPTTGNLKTSDCETYSRKVEPYLREATTVASPRHALKRLVGSTTVILVILLGLTIFAISRIPGKFLDPTDGVPNGFKPYVSKLSRYLNSQEDPDILLLGSSLFLFPSARCDDRMLGKPLCYDEWYMKQFVNDYDKSLYLEKQFKEAGLNPSIKNLAISSSLLSDQSAFFKTLTEAGKHPKLIVCGLAPRDFLDGTVRQSITPTQLLLIEYRANHNDSFAIDFSLDGLDQARTNITHHIEKSLGRVKSIATRLLNSIANRSETSQLVRMNTAARPNIMKDLVTYKKIYASNAEVMLAGQTEHLRKLLDCATEHGVKVVLVNMPLTNENKSLIDSKVYDKYVSTIRDAAAAHKMVFVDIGSKSTFDSKTDFEDSCHLGVEGGQKLFKTIVAAISQEPTLVEALTPTKH